MLNRASEVRHEDCGPLIGLEIASGTELVDAPLEHDSLITDAAADALLCVANGGGQVGGARCVEVGTKLSLKDDIGRRSEARPTIALSVEVSIFFDLELH